VAADGELDAAVLGQAAFGNIEVRHDLDARGDGKCQVARRGDHFIQHAVGFDADFEFVFEGLEVQVAGPVLDGQQQHHVEQLSHRRAFRQGFGAREIDGPFLRQRLGGGVQLGVVLHLAHERFDGVGARGVEAIEARLDFARRGDDRAHLVAEEIAQLVKHR
jgi:hypothetical protein